MSWEYKINKYEIKGRMDSILRHNSKLISGECGWQEDAWEKATEDCKKQIDKLKEDGWFHQLVSDLVDLACVAKPERSSYYQECDTKSLEKQIYSRAKKDADKVCFYSDFNDFGYFEGEGMDYCFNGLKDKNLREVIIDSLSELHCRSYTRDALNTTLCSLMTEAYYAKNPQSVEK